MTTLLKQERQVPSGFILPLDEVRHRVVTPKDQATALQAATPSGDGDGSKAPARDPLQPENQSVRPTPPGRRRSA